MYLQKNGICKMQLETNDIDKLENFKFEKRQENAMCKENLEIYNF